MSDGIELTDLKQKKQQAPLPPPKHPQSDTMSGELGKAYRLAEDKARAAVHLQEGSMDATGVWGCGAGVWFAILATPLLLFPRILLFFAQVAPINHLSASQKDILESREHYDTLTPLESFLCRTIGFGLIAISLIILFGLIPFYASPNTNPSRTPLLNVLVGLTSVMSVIAYNTTTIGALGKLVGAGNGVVALWGWWVIVFGNVKLKERDSKVPKRFKKL